MKISVDLNPQDLFGRKGTFAPYIYGGSQKKVGHAQEGLASLDFPDSLESLENNEGGVRGENPSSQKVLGLRAVLGALFLGAFIYGLLEVAQYSVSGRFLTPSLLQGPYYGPAFLPYEEGGNKQGQWSLGGPREGGFTRSFSQAGPSFDGRIPLWRVSEFEYTQMRSFLLDSTPRNLRKRLRKYIDLAFFFAEKYQVDPFWAISIMWVESHFNPLVRSRVNARGLMQIMPKTAHYLNDLLERSLTPSLAMELSKDPSHNIQLGIFYLDRLLRRFRGNYIYATVSYNMGPSFTERRLRRGLGVGVRNHYLTKVRRAYSRLTRLLRQKMRRERPFYKKTFVARGKAPRTPLIYFSEWLEGENSQKYNSAAQL